MMLQKTRNVDGAKHVRRLGHLDMPGGGQVVVAGRYAYVGHLSPPYGTSIIDVSDPRSPRPVSRVTLGDRYTHSHKVRVFGDLMFTNHEQDNRYYFRKGEQLEAYAVAAAKEHGRQPTDAELAEFMSRNLNADGKMQRLTEKDVAVLREAGKRGYSDGGFRIYDISDKTEPKLITHQRTHGWGVHRFDVDGRYFYASTEWEGYLGNIVVIYDIADPLKPTYVSHWAIPGQHVAAGEGPHWIEDNWRVHHALRQGDQLWVSGLWAGFFAVDISDIHAPRTLAHHNYHPPFSEPTHTALPLPFAVGGRRVAVVADETQIHRRGQPHGMLWLFDVTDLGAIKPLSVFTVSELHTPWARPESWFGCHQFQEHFADTTVCAAWFAGGVRIIDIKDPTRPVETGYFVPEPSGGATMVGTNDVEVDSSGLIYIIDRYNGFDILERTSDQPIPEDGDGGHGHGCGCE
jgi:hypothetical protein